MPLYVIATPIGNYEDITLRGKRLLEECEYIIGEETKPTRRLLKSIGISPQKNIELLNEHSTDEEIQSLVDICIHNNVALVSDCGTPGFCDPGARLVQLCRNQHISVFSIPGPSSLMALLSVSGYRLDRFLFEGFLPANSDIRKEKLKELKSEKRPLILMDTPYRLKKTMDDCEVYFPHRDIVLGLNMSTENEVVLAGKMKDIKKQIAFEKAEFVLIVLSSS